MILAWGMQSAMAPLHRLLRNRPALRISREASLEIGNAMQHTNLAITQTRAEAEACEGCIALTPPSRKPARLNSHATFGCKPTPSSAIPFAEPR